MAGSLVQVSTNTLTSASATASVTGISDNSVYCVTYLNFQGTTDHKYPNARFTVGGTAQTQSTYNWAGRKFKSYSSFQNSYGIGQTEMRIADENIGTATEELGHGIMYIYRAYDDSQSTFLSQKNVFRDSGGNLMNIFGGFNYTTNNSVDGISFHMESGNIDAGAVFTLYKVV